MIPFLWIIFPVSLCHGHNYIKELHHVTHSEDTLRYYSQAHTFTSPFTYSISYNDRTLDMKLYPAGHTDSLSTPFLNSHSNHSLLTGYLSDDPSAEVYGHFTRDGTFSGIVYTKHNTIHIEPSSRFGYTTSHNVVYHKSDVEFSKAYQHMKYAAPGPRPVFKIPRDRVVQPDLDTTITYTKRSGIPSRKRTCPVYLVSDHLFFKEMGGGDEQTTQNELILHLHEADKIFRSTDFNEDGVNDNVGFSVANISILKENTAQNKFSDNVIEVKEFLDRWSEYNHDQYCLAVLFTYRDFDSGVLGLAWVASVDGAPGGICQKRQAVSGYNRNLNTAIVSLINYGRYVGHAVSFITVAHELGHNFGSSHDEDTYSCSPGMSGGGNYIMYARATDGNLPNNVKFSSCSKDAITRVLAAKSMACFQEETSFCGNKIKEWDEVCDCGNTDTCNAVDHCCTPKSSHSEGCTLRKARKYNSMYSDNNQCSPQEGPCCEASDCSFKEKSVTCQKEDVCTHSSYCNGLSAECPEAPHKNGTRCNDGANTCSDGECKGSVCQLVGLAECQCLEHDLCTVCCMESDGQCRPTGSLRSHQIQRTYLMSGRSCNMFQGYCNSKHECIQVNLENPLSSLDDVFSRQSLGNAFLWLRTHWYYTITIVGCTILLCILLKVTYRRSAPIQKYVHHISQTLRRVGRPSHYQHHLILSPTSVEDQDKLSRMCAMFPTASQSVTWDIRRDSPNEETAVIKMLNLGYPFKPNPFSL